ncbi:hypothetical protein WICMUC_001060 [Wickerhamomyces mucosus]|uniref:DM2 domain-containing protein n=1 Tax=Wickerhamomyces mucosus TaxID=1378264 RepID=A0A9P8PXF0_9ASCO|nr:hypothetical protein WICMUC_001060 [Wickerhamomyces mucosus]
MSRSRQSQTPQHRQQQVPPQGQTPQNQQQQQQQHHHIPPQGITAVQSRPTNANISDSIAKIIPEVELYRKLQEAEKRIDILTARKLNNLQENINKVPLQKELLRIFIYNTATNQPWQLQGQSLQPQTVEPEWTLRIEGRLVNDEKPEDLKRRKFSSFLSGISIDILPNITQPQPQDSNPIPRENVIEWHDPIDPNTHKVDFDGLDVKRKGAENLKTKITIQPKDLPIRLLASLELSSLLGVNEITQHDAVYSIWQYIQYNNLQAAEDKRIINCDNNLSRLFGVPRFNFSSVLELLSKHLKPKPPIEIDYEIQVNKASTLGEVVIDIEVSVQDFNTEEAIRNESKVKLNEVDNSVNELNTKIQLGLQGLNNSYRKFEFYNDLSNDPVNFLREFNESNAKLLKILSGDDHYNEYDVRKSEYYTDDLLTENIDVLLKAGRI